MFRRLAEAFDNQEPASSGQGHAPYAQQQNRYFNTLPNIIPSATSGLKGFSKAIQSVLPQSNAYQTPNIPFANDIFMTTSSTRLNQLAKQCETNSLDNLLASQNPNNSIGCGWLYTPPTQGSPYPQLSQGFIGDVNGPFTAYNPPSYNKWFFDLNAAKRQILLDKCKSLSNCNDVNQSVYSGSCGYCTDINQGVPIDSNGNPLYPDSNIGNCSPTSIISNNANCPPPAPTIGPTPSINGVCDPINGQLSAMCLYNTVTSGGCSDQGTLALALNGSPPPNDYIASIRNGNAVSIYNRVANPPLNLDIFSNGQASIATVLQEVRQLASNASTNPSNSAIGASARDLCLSSGALDNYDFCGDLPDSSSAPYDIGCLQKLFMKMGGQPAGAVYPSIQTISTYNTIPTLGGVKQYWNNIIANMKNSDYNTQRTALINFLGISPEQMIKRAPWVQGVEVLWFSVLPNIGIGFLKRTIENDIPQFIPGDTSVIPQIGFAQFGAYMAITDVRAQNDFSVNFKVTVDDYVWITMNQPADFDYTAAQSGNGDSTGLFASQIVQAPTTYQGQSCSVLTAKYPNIYKVCYQDVGGGGHAIQINSSACSGQNGLNPMYYTLTCEQRAPYINYEVNLNSMALEDTRNTWLFSQFLTVNNGEYHTRSEELNNVPGNKGFLRLNNGNSSIIITSISYQAWSGCNIAFRMYSMPINDNICVMNSVIYTFNIVLKPINGSTAQASLLHNWNGSPETIPIPGTISLNQWYYLGINQTSTSVSIFIDTPTNIININGGTLNTISVSNSNMFYGPNFINNLPGPCNISVGDGRGSSSFNFDVAFVHFFSNIISNADWVREAKCNWIFTQMPTSLNSYTS
jgi:hypothetical protein